MVHYTCVHAYTVVISHLLPTQGNFSESDRSNWTPELKRILNFDQTRAMSVDNGQQTMSQQTPWSLNMPMSCIQGYFGLTTNHCVNSIVWCTLIGNQICLLTSVLYMGEYYIIIYDIICTVLVLAHSLTTSSVSKDSSQL